MPKYTRKQREIKLVDYEDQVKIFLQSQSVAFIPTDQSDTHRYHWHCMGEKFNLATPTLKLWRVLPICGRHKHPIIGIKPGTNPYSQTYDSDYECDYECDDDDCFGNCCYMDKTVSKVKTVVIFNEESSAKINQMNKTQIKDFLVCQGSIKKVNSRYTF